MNRKDYEIMAPVGSYESLMAAINADALYRGAIDFLYGGGKFVELY